jgi:glutamyl/glutaminyl-tRNA synthetase
MASILDDLLWMDIKVDDVLYQSQMEDDYRRLLNHLNGTTDLFVQDRFMFDNQPELTYTNAVPYPYAPYLTAEKVLLDCMSYINLLIRGDDLITEFSLYTYFCDLWGLPKPRQVYLPRLRIENGKELQSEVSKATGSYKVKGYRERGYSADELKANLAEACLIDPNKGWLLKNIKARPVWNG